jgi:hypothetical protein
MITAMTDTPEWLTWPQAADLAGCPVTTIETYVRTGRIESRGGQGRRGGSLRRASVEEFAAWWHQETARRERRRAERAERRIRPPEPEGWIQTTEAAELLGFRHSDHVIWLARQGRFEARKVSTRWWVRRADVWPTPPNGRSGCPDEGRGDRRMLARDHPPRRRRGQD